MLFNSQEFLVFFILVWAVYWTFLSKRLLTRNLFLLGASYFFYGWWDWRFLSLILLSSSVDFLVGTALERTGSTGKRRALVSASLITNLGLLFVFKYFNFFADSLVDLAQSMGMSLNPVTLQFTLPVGISFYTFQTLSYTLDVYRGKLKATRDPLAFFAYVAFFPQLVAGPIERAANLLPQFQQARIPFKESDAADGLRMILWGLFLKAVVADNLSFHVNGIFDNHHALDGSVLILGIVYFSFQIYGDFAGYSSIARGVARLLGFELMINFRCPYFSRDIAEFWRRWHISLSTWFRDYLYIPLGGNRGGSLKSFRNISIVFLVSGLWHGANWTFVIWGAIHALLFLPLFYGKRHRNHTGPLFPGRILPPAGDLLGMAITFSLVSLAWIFFRSENLSEALSYLGGIFHPSLFSLPGSNRGGILWILLLLPLDYLHRNEEAPIRWPGLPWTLRWAGYLILANLIYFRGYFGEQEFIYFQF